MKMRLDQFLVDKNLVDSRAKAQQLINRGSVTVNGGIAQKPAYKVDETDLIKIVDSFKFVSRGGEKLGAALNAFGLTKLNGHICCDIGSSTGGFTDCLLQNGAGRVFAIDSGTECLHPSLRGDPRIVLMENTNIRDVASLPELMDLIVIDVSFIPLKLVIPHAKNLLKPDGSIIALIKPQFEAGKANVPRDGIIKDAAVIQQTVQNVVAAAKDHALQMQGLINSPIRGGDGNREFLILLDRRNSSLDSDAVIEGVMEGSDGIQGIRRRS